MSGCKEAEPGVAKIQQDIPVDLRTLIIDNETYDLTIDSLVVDKRATNDREDDVYCTVEMSNSKYEARGTYICEYEYYDKGGWILENAYLTDIELKCISDDIPDAFKSALSRHNFHYRDEVLFATDVNWRKSGAAQYDILYDIKTESKYRTLSGIYKVSYYPEWVGGLSFVWKCEEDYSDIDATWDIVGTYRGESFSQECEIVIDSYDNKTDTVHITSFKFTEDHFVMSDDYEEEDIYVNLVREQGNNPLDSPWDTVSMSFHRDEYGAYTGHLTFYPDKVKYAACWLEKVTE